MPDYLDARRNLAGCLMREGDAFLTAGETVPALARYREGVAASPNDPRLLTRLAGLLANEGEIGEALASLETALDADPTYEPAIRLREALTSLR